MEFTSDEQAAISAKQELLKAEAFLSKLKDSADSDLLRSAKEALRAQRQAYRETHRATAMALEANGVVVTPDSVTVKSG